MAWQVPAFFAAGSLTVDERGLWLGDWVGPPLTIPTLLLAE